MELSVAHRLIGFSSSTVEFKPRASVSQATFIVPASLAANHRKRKPMERAIPHASLVDDNGSISPASTGGNKIPNLFFGPDRIGEVNRVTKETHVAVKINLDGSGIAKNSTGIPFLDHMLDQLASHGLFDVNVKATGDIHIDDHHTNEDIALAMGTALLQALGDRKGINRPHLSYDLQIPTERVGTYDTQLVEHFFQSLVNTSGMTLHIRQLAGRNSHHIIEATFKAFARALRQATEYDVRRGGTVASSKGVLTRA
ncbi:hypothetical protein FNV43_RR01800 [Rhamnella rubrinervis]|uniref:Imidazoleglycerol-phosphate dehydratase n=1 Tax=Rhamnella rubrinervis TaxID=2594499 RepID=A0A8K0HS46_9ROSA|nr:hypothetical protein FNV43_RR01800 [Rhamnella rubrinervis]